MNIALVIFLAILWSLAVFGCRYFWNKAWRAEKSRFLLESKVELLEEHLEDLQKEKKEILLSLVDLLFKKDRKWKWKYVTVCQKCGVVRWLYQGEIGNDCGCGGVLPRFYAFDSYMNNLPIYFNPITSKNTLLSGILGFEKETKDRRKM